MSSPERKLKNRRLGRAKPRSPIEPKCICQFCHRNVHNEEHGHCDCCDKVTCQQCFDSLGLAIDGIAPSDADTQIASLLKAFKIPNLSMNSIRSIAQTMGEEHVSLTWRDGKLVVSGQLHIQRVTP